MTELQESERAGPAVGSQYRVHPSVARAGRSVEGDDTSLRFEVVQLVREQVRAGRYRPPVGDVVEQLAAWLLLEGPTHASATG